MPARARVARLLGVETGEVAFLAHASEGLNQAVRAVDWRAGDNVVVADLEYPSLIYPAALLRERGVEPRVVRARGHYVAMDDLAAQVDRRTRLVLVSHVSYLTGQRLDLARCAEIARGAGAWLAVDATHAAGVVPVPGELCDFVVSSCYKWLLATHGVGLFAYSARAWASLSRPPSAGTAWGIAAAPAIPSRCRAGPTRRGSRRATRACSVSSCSTTRWRGSSGSRPRTWSATRRSWATELIEGLRRAAWPVITPEAPEERAGNVCFLAADAGGLAARLAASGCSSGAAKAASASPPTSTTTATTSSASSKRWIGSGRGLSRAAASFLRERPRSPGSRRGGTRARPQACATSIASSRTKQAVPPTRTWHRPSRRSPHTRTRPSRPISWPCSTTSGEGAPVSMNSQ